MNLDMLRQIIDREPVFEPQEGDYAQLADEENETGLVNVYRKNGTLVLQMPREVWDQLRAHPKEK